MDDLQRRPSSRRSPSPSSISESASYELLTRVARRAGDEQTASLAHSALVEERAATERLHGLFVLALDVSLPSAV
jgi:hypothetical protein